MLYILIVILLIVCYTAKPRSSGGTDDGCFSVVIRGKQGALGATEISKGRSNNGSSIGDDKSEGIE